MAEEKRSSGSAAGRRVVKPAGWQWSNRRGLIPAAIVLLLALGAAVAWYVSRDPRGDEAVIVGAALPLTGPLALFGEPERAVLSRSVAEANRGDVGGRGGVRGRPIRLVIEDSRGSARDGVSATQKILLQEPAAVISSLTLVANATQQILTESRTPQIALSVHPKLAERSRYTTRPYYGFEQEMRVLADYFRRKGFRRVGVLWVMVPECESAIEDVLRPELTKSGGAIVASESYKLNDTNLRPQLTKVAASDPDVILVMDYGNLFGLILRDAESLGVRGKVVGNIGLLTAPPIDPALLDGVAFSGPSFVINDSPSYREFAAEFERETGTKPTYDVLYTKDAFDLLVRAMRESANGGGEIDRERLAQRLREMGEFEGVTGKMRIDPASGNVSVDIGMGYYRGGEIQPLR